MGFLTYKNNPDYVSQMASPAPTAAPANLDQLIQQYNSNPSGGIPNDLYRYAQDHPEAGIDRSGWNLSTSDPMYNFYNPTAGQTQGVNWFPNDDRNNPFLNPNFDPSTTAYNPQNVNQLSGSTSPFTLAHGETAGGGSNPQNDANPSTPPTDPRVAMLQGPNAPTPPPQGGGSMPAASAGGGPSAPTSATAAPQYDFSNIMNQYGIQNLANTINPALQQIIQNMNQGLSPQVMSAMRSQATSAIPHDYENAARQLRSNLLRSGAIGAGELPAASGDILRSFAPLEQARNEAVAGANRSTILANQAEIARNQNLGMQALTAGLDYMKATTLAGLDVATRLKLAQMGIDSNEKLAQLQSQTQLALGNLDSQTRLTISQLDNETQRWMGTLNSTTQKELAQLASQTNIDINKLDNATKLKVADIENAPGSLKSILLASVLGTAASGANSPLGKVLGTATDGLINIFKGKPEDADKTVKPAVGDKIAGLLKDPITLAIGGAIAATTIWLKSQAHWEANTWVQGYQNKFDQQVGDINKQFWDLAQSGKLTKAMGQQLRDSVKEMMDTYESQRQKFATQGSDEKTVAGQALATFNYWYGQNGDKFLGAMDQAIGQLA